MRKLTVISFLTLDGVMQSPGAKDEDTEGGFGFGGWQLPFFEDSDTGLDEVMKSADALLIGRKTYEIFASYWPTTGKDIEWIGDYMNNITKYVASRRLKKVEWQNSQLLVGNVVHAIAEIKAQSGKDIIVFGSGDLVQTLMSHNLVDEYFLTIHPLILGSGKRLFRESEIAHDLVLLKSKTTKKGVVALTYKVKSRFKLIDEYFLNL